MSHKLYFHLTEDQKKLFRPLFKQVNEAFAKGKRGLIFAQIKEDADSVAGFIPEKYSIKMIKIMQEMDEREHVEDLN